MPYDVLDEYTLSSLKREIEQSMGNVSKADERIDSLKRDLDSKIREIKSAQSSLDRAMDDRIRELQRSVGKSGGYSSYSSAENSIKSERRRIEGLLDKFCWDIRILDDLRRFLKSSSEKVLPNLEKIQRSHDALRKCMDQLSKEREEVARKNSVVVESLKRESGKEIEKLKRESRQSVEELKRENDVRERKLRSEIESERNKAMLAGVAALSVCIPRNGDAREDACADEKIARIEESCDRKIAELTAQYESKIAALKDAAVQERYESRIKRISDLLEDKKLELQKSNADLEAAGAELEDARRLNQTLSIELSQERSCVANYKAILKKRTVAYLIMRMLLATRRFVINWYLYLAAGFVLICFAIILYGLFA